MKQKKITRIGLIAALLLLAPGMVAADFNALDYVMSFNAMNSNQGISFQLVSGTGYGDSAEVRLTSTGIGTFADTSAYSTSNQISGSNYFSSFCVSNESFTIGATANGKLNYDYGVTRTRDELAITLGAAWLYKLFATGEINSVLGGYNSLGEPMYIYSIFPERNANAAAFQQALKMLIGADQTTSWNSNNYTYTLIQYAMDTMGMTSSQAMNFWTQNYALNTNYDLMGDYVVFSMYSSQGSYLYMTTKSGGGSDVPEPATILIWTLGGMGLAGSAWRRNRKNAQ